MGQNHAKSPKQHASLPECLQAYEQSNQMNMTSSPALVPHLSSSSPSREEAANGHGTTALLSSHGRGGPTRDEHATSVTTTVTSNGEPQQPLLRIASTKSVQFAPQNMDMPRQRSLRGSGGDTGTAEDVASSSADETTGIIRRERGVGRSYSTAESSAVAADVRGSRRSSESRKSRRSSRHSEEGGSDQPNQHTDGWFKAFVDKYGTVELDNKGSVARDHLALERTFLAWLRTSLAFASIGVAITQLFRLSSTASSPSKKPQHLQQVGKPLGATFLAIAIVVLFIGFHRYFESQHWIIRGKFPASRGSIALVTAMGGALIVVSLVVVIAVGGSTFET